jgi:uncharacterized protein YbaR (Trm112 family)
MKKEYLDILCCPVCKGDMKLKVIKTSRDEIIEGILTCDECENRYFIRNGTAYLVPEGVPQKTAYPMYINRETDERKGT